MSHCQPIVFESTFFSEAAKGLSSIKIRKNTMNELHHFNFQGHFSSSAINRPRGCQPCLTPPQLQPPPHPCALATNVAVAFMDSFLRREGGEASSRVLPGQEHFSPPLPARGSSSACPPPRQQWRFPLTFTPPACRPLTLRTGQTVPARAHSCLTFPPQVMSLTQTVQLSDSVSCSELIASWAQRRPLPWAALALLPVP